VTNLGFSLLPWTGATLTFMNGSADELDADDIAEILWASDLSPQNADASTTPS
jgi:hypothetical protein